MSPNLGEKIEVKRVSQKLGKPFLAARKCW